MHVDSTPPALLQTTPSFKCKTTTKDSLHAIKIDKESDEKMFQKPVIFA